MAKKYISRGQLSIASKLFDFVNNELLPGTGITKGNFWLGLDKCAHELSTKNKNPSVCRRDSMWAGEGLKPPTAWV